MSFHAARNTDSYNKTAPITQGTLVANWLEERALRDQTGEGRTIANSHVNKHHEDLFLNSATELQATFTNAKQGDKTFSRIFGSNHSGQFNTEQTDQYYKKVYNNQPLHGKKHSLVEKQYLDIINKELDIAYKTFDNQFSQRQLETTYGNEFLQKDLTSNVVGKRIMKDQNLHPLTAENRDEDLLVNNGFIARNPLTSESELQASLKNEKYETAQPYTFWVEKNNDGNYYKSKQTSEVGPFTKNNEFLKTFHQYTHVKH